MIKPFVNHHNVSNVNIRDLLLLYFCVPNVVQYVLFADPVLHYKFIVSIFMSVKYEIYLLMKNVSDLQ
jgi:hypothetical protein